MTQTSQHVPIADAAGAGYSFALSRWRDLLPAIAVAVAGLCIVAYAQGEFLARLDDGASAMRLLFIALPGLFVVTVAWAAMLRLAGRPGEPAAAAVAVGRDEINLFLAQILLGLFFTVVAAFMAIVGVSLLTGLTAASGVDPAAGPDAVASVLFSGGMGLVVATLLLALVAIGLYVVARLTLYSIATISEGRIQVFSTWAWTKGEGWRILAALFLVGAPFAVVAAIVSGILGGVVSPTGSVADPETGALVVPVGTYVATQAVGGVVSALGMVAQAGTLAFLYKGLRPTGGPPAPTV